MIKNFGYSKVPGEDLTPNLPNLQVPIITMNRASESALRPFLGIKKGLFSKFAPVTLNLTLFLIALVK